MRSGASPNRETGVRVQWKPHPCPFPNPNHLVLLPKPKPQIEALINQLKVQEYARQYA